MQLHLKYTQTHINNQRNRTRAVVKQVRISTHWCRDIEVIHIT